MASSENTSSSSSASGRLSDIVNIELLDPLLLEAMLAVLGPGGTNVAVEFNILSFVVDENEMDHAWHPGPMEVDEYAYDDTHDEDKDEEEIEDDAIVEEDEGNEEEDEEDGEALFSDGEYGENYENDDYDDVDLLHGEGEEDEDGNINDYSSQHDDEEDEGDDDDEDGEEDGEGEIDNEDEDYVEDDNDDDVGLGFIDDSVLENYGSLGWAICHTISDRKILHDGFNSRYFLRQMVEYFFTHMSKEGNMASSLSLQKLLSCLPPLSDLKHLISKTKYTMKEAIIIKVVLEMYESYHKSFGAPNYKIYHTEVIPLLLDFYNRLPDGALKLISKQLQRVLLNINSLTDNFKLFYTKQEYIAHYRDVNRQMRNLSECTDPALFLR